MNRNALEKELKRVGVSLNGWLPVLKCDSCGHHWEPFSASVGAAAPTIRFDYWRCKNGCNADSQPTHALQTAMPKFVMVNDIPGMLFGEEDRREFEEYVRSLDATEVPNRIN